MEKEEKVIDQTVDTSTKVNEDVIKTEDENIVDDNTTTEDSDVDEPVVSTEDQTLAPTDDVIPAPVDTPVVDTPVSEPVADAPLADIVPPSFDVPVDNPVVDPVVDAPVTDAPVEVPGSEVVDPIIPEDPAPVVTDPAPELNDENPTDVTEPCERGCCDDGACCDNTCSTDITVPGENPSCSPVTVANYFGTLQDCVTIAWRFHLKTKIYRYHKVLNDFYDSALHIVDDIIEQYQGICGVVEDTFTNCVVGDGKTEGEYFTELKAFVENNKCVLGDHSELNSVVDEFLSLIDSTLYQLTSFTENAVKSFEEFVYEDYPAIKESCCGNNGDSDNDLAEEE